MRNIATSQSAYCLRHTAYGPLVVVWSALRGLPEILRVFLSRPGRPAEELARASFFDARASSCAEIGAVAEQMVAFLEGEDVRFSLDITRMDLCSAFQQRVLRAEHGIPRGQVSTYQRIATYLGSPLGARAVGTALATNPFPVLIPCHRAIRSDGTLGGYQGGLAMKRALLEMEGVRVDESRRVEVDRFFY
ncbi:MAG: methylated-DNA--[protein]-cysteine S-methyltransferase [Chloroflexi bacterium]|nr:methylated-DNA--[protein]-cysteine S-methyltransferase [Chloroflexota bacterium]